MKIVMIVLAAASICSAAHESFAQLAERAPDSRMSIGVVGGMGMAWMQNGSYADGAFPNGTGITGRAALSFRIPITHGTIPSLGLEVLAGWETRKVKDAMNVTQAAAIPLWNNETAFADVTFEETSSLQLPGVMAAPSFTHSLWATFMVASAQRCFSLLPRRRHSPRVWSRIV